MQKGGAVGILFPSASWLTGEKEGRFKSHFKLFGSKCATGFLHYIRIDVVNHSPFMIKTDPIIAVKDVEHSSKWYRLLFGCRSMHGGNKFDILVDENDEVLLCLHKWGEDGHPTMVNQNITPGNGLILYFRTKNINIIRENAEKIGSAIERDLRVNPNSNHMEFSLRDPDGYYISVTEFHNYEG